MHEIKLNVLTNDRSLPQAVLQITQLLGMYPAELLAIVDESHLDEVVDGFVTPVAGMVQDGGEINP